MIKDFKIFEETKMVKIIYAKDVYDKYRTHINRAELVKEELKKELVDNIVKVEASNDDGKTYFDYFSGYRIIKNIINLNSVYIYIVIEGASMIINQYFRFTIKPKPERVFSDEDPYGEEDWDVNESISNVKFNVGDIVYFVSGLYLFKDYVGEVEILSIYDGWDKLDWYSIRSLNNNKSIKWISGDDLYNSKEEAEIEQRRIDSNREVYKEYLKRKEEKRKERIEAMKDVDPYGEEDWDVNEHYTEIESKIAKDLIEKTKGLIGKTAVMRSEIKARRYKKSDMGDSGNGVGWRFKIEDVFIEDGMIFITDQEVEDAKHYGFWYNLDNFKILGDRIFNEMDPYGEEQWDDI